MKIVKGLLFIFHYKSFKNAIQNPYIFENRKDIFHFTEKLQNNKRLSVLSQSKSLENEIKNAYIFRIGEIFSLHKKPEH